MSDGYIKLHRSIMDHHLFGSGRLTEREAWIWLIANAAWHDHKVRWHSQMIEIKRGQVPASYRKMAQEWGWAVNTVRKFVSLLKNEKMIDTYCDTGFSVITICNYEKYQSIEKNNDTETDTRSDTDTDTGSDTNRNKGNKGKEKKNITHVVLPEWLPTDLWAIWKTHRRAIKRPMTHPAEKLLIKDLENLRASGYDPAICIENAIKNGYHGIFAPPIQKPLPSKHPPVPGSGW